MVRNPAGAAVGRHTAAMTTAALLLPDFLLIVLGFAPLVFLGR